MGGSHLFQRVASFLRIPERSRKPVNQSWFSSLSESGFIPTLKNKYNITFTRRFGSHLFQRVASFLHLLDQVESQLNRLSVLISFREWLHSYTYLTRLSHSWTDWGSHLFQRVASFLLKIYKSFAAFLQKGFSSLSESGFIPTKIWWKKLALVWEGCSHLFQRVASFLHVIREILVSLKRLGFSSLSESGFIPTDEARAVL